MAATAVINFEIKKHMTNGICLAGGNLFSMKHLLTKKYISKKELKELLDRQEQYLRMIENSKNVTLQLINDEIPT